MFIERWVPDGPLLPPLPFASTNRAAAEAGSE